MNKLIQLFTALFQLISRLLSRVLCFLHIRRGRKNSGSLLPTHVTTTQLSVPTNNATEPELQSWETWGKEDLGIATGSGQSDSQERNFFKDMEPEFHRNPKILLKLKEESHGTGVSSRLTMYHDIPAQGGELGVWEEVENGWGPEEEEDLSWHADSAIREKRLLERQRRQQENMKKKMEKDAQKQGHRGAGLAAVKLS